MHRSGWVLAIVVVAVEALSLLGCEATNSIVEVQLAMPPNPEDPVEVGGCAGPDGERACATGGGRCDGDRCVVDQWHVQLQVADGAAFPFADADDTPLDWQGLDLPPAAPLPAVPSDRYCVSVAGPASMTRLHAKVRYCAGPDCAPETVWAEHWWTIGEPLHDGRRTYVREALAGVADALAPSTCAIDADCGSGSACLAGRCGTRVDRCQVAGCLGGDRPHSYCDEDGAHECERRPSVDLDPVSCAGE